ncbi:MAG TPA: phosphatase PAP2 family protein [Chloroflexia bacterium]|nr:phosphatase PAP2 family protein [Chloroflexia bacterium]
MAKIIDSDSAAKLSEPPAFGRSIHLGNQFELTTSELVELGSSALLAGLSGVRSEAVIANKMGDFDRKVMEFLGSGSNKKLEKAFRVLTVATSEKVNIGLSIATFAFFWQRKQYLSAWLVLLATAGSMLFTIPLKYVLNRTRPLSINSIVNKGGKHSYPSGHSVAAFCYYGTLTWLGLKAFKHPSTRFGWACLMISLIFLVGLSRAYLKEHHSSDVLGGYLMGSAWLLVLICGAQLYAKKQANNS